MHRNKFAWFTLAVLMILSMLISACGGGQATTQAPQATQPAAATSGPTSAPSAGGTCCMQGNHSLWVCAVCCNGNGHGKPP